MSESVAENPESLEIVEETRQMVQLIESRGGQNVGKHGLCLRSFGGRVNHIPGLLDR